MEKINEICSIVLAIDFYASFSLIFSNLFDNDEFYSHSLPFLNYSSNLTWLQRTLTSYLI
jgi:hypothetical protein